MLAPKRFTAVPQISIQAKSKLYRLRIFIVGLVKRIGLGVGIPQQVRDHAESTKHYLASMPVRIPSPSVNVEPTLPTTADFRVSPARSRNRYTASIPVQWAPSRLATLNSFSLSPVQFSCLSLAANRCSPPTTAYTGSLGNFCFT